MAVGHFSLLSPKTFDSFFLMISSSWKILIAPIGPSWWLSPKTFDSYFQNMMYVGLMKNFRLSDSSELLAIRLVLTYWAQKCLIPTFYTWCTSSWWKILISPIRASWWPLESFRHPDPKTFDSNFRDMMYVGFMKNFLLYDSSELIGC